MKISKYRLRKIINESCRKIILKEFFPAVTLVLSSEVVLNSVLWAISSSVLTKLYMAGRSSSTFRNSRLYNAMIENDEIAELIALTANWALENRDDRVLSEIKKAGELGKKIAKQMGVSDVSMGDVTLTSADFLGGIVKLGNRIISTPVGLILTSTEVAHFELNTLGANRSDVETAFNTIEGILTIALDIKAGNIGSGNPQTSINISNDGLVSSSRLGSKPHEVTPGEGPPPGDDPDIGPGY